MGWQRAGNGEVDVIKEVAVVAGPGSINLNLFQLFGTVRVIDQVAEITEITTLNNLTNMYADLWDGTMSEGVTADGAVLSGLPVKTVFVKDKILTQPFTVMDASQCCVNETLDDKRIGKPFTITQKSAADTFLRLNFQTTDSPVSFKMLVMFKWKPLDGGELRYLG